MVYLQIPDATVAVLVDGRSLTGPWQGFVAGVQDGTGFIVHGTVSVSSSGVVLESELIPQEVAILWPCVLAFFLAGLRFARSLR